MTLPQRPARTQNVRATTREQGSMGGGCCCCCVRAFAPSNTTTSRNSLSSQTSVVARITFHFWKVLPLLACLCQKYTLHKQTHKQTQTMRLYTLSLSGVADAVQQRHPGVLEALELLPDAIKVVLHPPCLIMCVCVCVCEELFFLWLSSICAVHCV